MGRITITISNHQSSQTAKHFILISSLSIVYPPSLTSLHFPIFRVHVSTRSHDHTIITHNTPRKFRKKNKKKERKKEKHPHEINLKGPVFEVIDIGSLSLYTPRRRLITRSLLHHCFQCFFNRAYRVLLLLLLLMLLTSSTAAT